MSSFTIGFRPSRMIGCRVVSNPLPWTTDLWRGADHYCQHTDKGLSNDLMLKFPFLYVEQIFRLQNFQYAIPGSDTFTQNYDEREPNFWFASCKGRGKRSAVILFNLFQLLKRVISITHPSFYRLGAFSGCIENTSG